MIAPPTIRPLHKSFLLMLLVARQAEGNYFRGSASPSALKLKSEDYAQWPSTLPICLAFRF